MASNKSQMSETRWWTELPPDLLEMIYSKLTFSNYLRFRGVCKSWRCAARLTNLPPPIPLLMLRYDPNDSTRSFINPSTNNVHTIDLPEFRGYEIFGSSNGWLVLGNNNLNIFLFNPVTRSTINLPPTVGTFSSTLKLNRDEILQTELFLIPYGFKCFAFMSSYPELPSDCLVVFLTYSSKQLVYCRVGDEAWTPVDYGYGITSLAYHNGKFYSWNYGVVSVYDVSDAPLGKFTYIPSLEMEGKCFLVSAGEDLLLLDHYDYEIGSRFVVYRLGVKGSSVLRWVKIEEIGDLKVFVRLHSCFIVVSEASGCTGNTIYFSTFDKCQQIGAYNIKKRCLEEACDLSRQDLSRPFWFTPKIN